MTENLTVGRREVRITHADRPVFPDAKLTKLDLARHYERVAPLMLPYTKDRPLALQAYPDGIEGDGFFMKAVPKYFPDWVKRATMHKKGGIKLIDKASLQLYGDKPGPDFLADDGSMFRRFARALPKEAELVDRVNLAATKLNTLVFLNNLGSAS